MSNLGLNIALHASGVALFGYSLFYDLVYVHAPPELTNTTDKFKALSSWPGKWKFLTLWNLVLQLVYHVVSLGNDLFGSSELNVKRQTWFQKFRDGLFASWVFPTGLFVSLSFWTLYAIDRALVFPVELDSFYPCWLNHAVHTGPILFLTINSYFVPKSYPSKAYGIIGNLFFSSVYSAWIVWINYHTQVWAYPILHVLDNTQRAIFIGSSGLIIFTFYFLGEALNSWRWGGKVEGKGHATKAKSAGKGKRKTK